MILNDAQIDELADAGMIVPFEARQIRNAWQDDRKTGDAQVPAMTFPVISFGLSSFGYDIRLSGREFKIFRRIPGHVVDPKNFESGNLERAQLHFDDDGSKYFVLPGNSYGLGVAVEAFNLPADIVGICLGKSTYARCGIIVNVTPAEPGWKGHLTLEFSNSSEADCRIYADEGAAQVLFFKGERCATSYEDRKGKYQNQGHEVVLPKV